MKKEQNCEIVQDLLQKYMDSLTSDETNKFVEEHLKNCEKCKNTYNTIKESLKDTEDIPVDFFKKYHSKMNLLKIIIVGILIAICLIFVCMVGRKMIILNDLKKKSEDLSKLTCFYQKTYSYGDRKCSDIRTVQKRK